MELLGLGGFVFLTIGVIILAMRGMFAKDLTLALRRVTQKEKELQAKADVLENRLGQIERECQAKLKRADEDAEQILRETKEQAFNIRAVAIDEAKQRARQLLVEAELHKNQLRSELMRQLSGHFLTKACESVKRLLPKDELSSLHHGLVDEMIKALHKMDSTPLCADAGHIEVTSAQELKGAESNRISDWATTALGKKISVKVETDASLVAGCVVRIGDTVLDSTLSSRLRGSGGADE